MSIFKQTLKEIVENKKRLESNKVNCIPFEWKRFKNYIPGIMKGTNWIITASSGVGKSQLSKYLFMYSPYKWIKQNPEKKISLKIMYFALEESKKEFMYTMISNKLYEEDGIEIDVLTLQSFFQGEKKLSNEIIKKIESYEEYFEDLESKLDVIDTISNPTGIYKYIRNYASENGVHYYYNFKNDKQKNNEITEEEYKKLENKNNWAYSKYQPNNPDEYVICIVDHISLLNTERGAETLHSAMTMMSAEYGRKQVTKHFNYVFVMVQQQSAESEKKQYTTMGDAIEEKLEPSLNGLADNKLTQRDQHVVLGLFAPDRYKISSYKVGDTYYNVNILKDNFRVLFVLKNRIGRPNARLPLFFNGAINNFEEAPKMINSKDYEKFIKK